MGHLSLQTLSLVCLAFQCAGPSPGTTKNLHLAVLSLCLNLTVHT